MKNVLVSAVTTLALVAPLATPSFAGVSVVVPAALEYPTDFDGYMADKSKKSKAKKPQQKTQDR